MSVDEGRRVTLAGIAREAGVSVLTVSRVLSGRSDEAPRTRQRVEELLSRYGYRRDPRPPPARIGLIDVVFDELANGWELEFARGVEEVAHASGVGTVVTANHGRSTAARRWLQNLRSRATDGVILAAAELAPPIPAELSRLNVPLVLVDPAGEPASDVATITATNTAGGRQATEHLLSLGHRRIGLITGTPNLLCSRQRGDGYRAALQAAGVAVSDDLIRAGDFGAESGFEAATVLLHLDSPPTAIFAAGDQMALGAYEATRRIGLRVPEDVSVVGFDDLPAARWAGPPLTTVRRPLTPMGVLAARTVLRLGRGERLECPRVELATELVVRDSSAPPATIR